MHPRLIGCLPLAAHHGFLVGCSPGLLAGLPLAMRHEFLVGCTRGSLAAFYSPRAMVSGGVHTGLIGWPAIRLGPIDCQIMACRTNRVFDNIHEVGTMGMSDLRSPSAIAVGGTAPRDNGRCPPTGAFRASGRMTK
jgi:hypothetical protein